VPSLVTDGLAGQDAGEREHSFVPDFAWAVVGGIALLALSVVVYSLTVTWGGFNPGTTPPGGPVAPISAYFREFAGLFLIGFLVVLIARALSVRTDAPPRSA